MTPAAPTCCLEYLVLSNIIGLIPPRLPFQDLSRLVQPVGGLRPEDWAPHPHGGGWVQKSASVALSVFIAPCSVVGGEARLTDRARVLDEAVVNGTAIVADDAVVYGRAYVSGRARILGHARVGGSAEVGGFFVMEDGELTTGVHQPRDYRSRKRWARLVTR
jgi:UDP-3-O-[3-hydroxymyristoyl] glucosamine N-acyltransferase